VPSQQPLPAREQKCGEGIAEPQTSLLRQAANGEEGTGASETVLLSAGKDGGKVKQKVSPNVPSKASGLFAVRSARWRCESRS